ncbi:hypothetical protein GGU10DRAFT_392152 [Lentinula aff. detonsa]|uniref:Uncharacterized protein n=1 Tax=Lentinula aff. detonsa TaxID=2804958 RepID=A0AA38U029_9AGAR|nr:hypothetical protein GGU10DRAFT_392152 [Lentinula aff. detonsa]
MAYQASYPDNPSYSQPPNGNLQPTFDQDEFKSSYDDLIDEYSSPYAANSRHQTYAVQTPALSGEQHRRGPSYPLSQKQTFSSKQSNDSSHDLTAVAYPPRPPQKQTDTRTFWQKVLPESLACRFYVITVLVETTIDLAIEGKLLVQVHEADASGGGDTSNPNKMPVYLSIFVLAHLFQFVMAIDAVYARNTLQFIFLTVFNALFLVYAIIQIGEIREIVVTGDSSAIPINVLTAIIPIVISIAELAYIGLGWKIYNEFGWKVYKFLGADRRIKKMYANYQIYECLVKFDVFFWAGFSVQFIWLVLQKTDWEYYVTCAAMPLSLVLLVEGHLAARHENKWMMATFMSGCVGAMVYFVYKLVKVFMYKNTDDLKLVWKTLMVFSVIAIVLLVATFVLSIMVMRNFGRGLKGALARKNTHQRYGSTHPAAFSGPASLNPNRMSID